jgi:hypothetical protein
LPFPFKGSAPYAIPPVGHNVIVNKRIMLANTKDTPLSFVPSLLSFTKSHVCNKFLTRQHVIRLAVEAGIEVVEEAVAENMKEYIHEAFLAGTTVEITPITSLGDFVIRDGQPGSVTKLIQEKFYALVASGKAK